MPGSTNFNTPDRLIRMAMKDVGFLQDGEDPTNEEFADNLNRLNDIINFEQTQGLKLWLQHDLEIPLVAGQATYVLGPSGDVDMTRPTRVLDNGYYSDTNGFRRNLILMSRDEYTRRSNPFGQGTISSYFPNKLQNNLEVTMWLVPDAQAATGTVHVLIQQQIQNLVSLTDSVNFPMEWFMWLRWALASDICIGQPQAVVDRCTAFAEGYRAALEAWDVEDAATIFTPDQRMAYRTGAFK